MDSIDIDHKYCICNNYGYIFTVVQRSIRFAKMKKLAVYNEMEYRGTYEVVEHHHFRVKNLTNMISLMMFGEHQKYGIEELKKMKVKGRMSDETEMYFVCLRFVEFEEKFTIKLRDHEAIRDEKRQREVVELRPGATDVVPF